MVIRGSHYVRVRLRSVPAIAGKAKADMTHSDGR